MKKVLILSLFISFLFPGVSFAQEASMTVREETLESSQSATPHIDDYVLPYPGLLPDNPLYILKTTRDRIVSLLISDPLKKAEFNLLQADKRVESGKLLIEKDKKKYELAITTISKGENYFEEALAKVEEAEVMKLETAEIKGKLRRAIHKHKQVVHTLHTNAPKEYKEELSAITKRVLSLEEKVLQLIARSSS